MEICRINPARAMGEKDVELWCKKAGLQCTMRASLKSIGPNMHWHYKRREEPGLLEITLMLKTGELILSCKKNRQAPWMEELASNLQGNY